MERVQRLSRTTGHAAGSLLDTVVDLPRDLPAATGLSVNLQREPPGKGADATWMPTSGDRPWLVNLRLYRAQPAVLDDAWRCPPITWVA